MKVMRAAPLLLSVLLSPLVLMPQDSAPTVEPDTPTIRTTVDVVVAPVTVTSGSGQYVNGLQPQDFRLFDNGVEQNINVDVSFVPISLVLAIQANAEMEGILPQIQKIGPMIQPLVTGEAGEAAVLAFDHRLQPIQEFTSDGNKIDAAIKKIRPGSSSSRMIDAVQMGIRMLRTRPPNHRRILLLISETRDKASEGRIRDAVIDAQLQNVLVFTVNVNRLMAKLSSKPQPGRPDPLPPAMRPLPPNVPATPTTVAQTTGAQGGRAEFVPLLVEMYKDVKGVFADNPAEALTKGTGGVELSFARQRGLEEAISRIGEELHSQYLISYNPSNKSEGGFHEIQVALNRRDVRIRTRPGYWLAAK
jgi:VWFA-related protein